MLFNIIQKCLTTSYCQGTIDNMWKDRGQLFGTVTVGALAIFGLHRVTARVPIDWSDPISWLNRSPIEDVLTEIIRLVALGLAYWFVLSTVLYFLAVISRMPGAIRAVEWATLPAMRSITRRVAAVTLATSMAAPAAMLLAPPAPEPATSPISADASSELSIPFGSPDQQPLVRMTDDGVVVPPGYRQPSEPVYEPTVGTPETSASSPPENIDTSSSDSADSSVREASMYTVVDGDNLWTIAKRHLTELAGTPPTDAELVPYWVEVIDLNLPNLTSGDADMIYPGEVIELPAVEGTVP